MQTDHIFFQYFRPDRRFVMPLWTERLLGKPIVFALNNAWAKYYQVDFSWPPKGREARRMTEEGGRLPRPHVLSI